MYVTPPTKATHNNTSDGRLFARLGVWDHTKNTAPDFRGKAMLRLASLPEGEDAEYERRLGADELRQPRIASLRLRLQSTSLQPDTEADATELNKTQAYNVLAAVVAKANPCTLTGMAYQVSCCVANRLSARS